MKTKNIIFDGEFYYIFHAFESGDYSDKTGQIRSYSTRKIEQTGENGKYNISDGPTLKEVYEHIKMRFNPDTNCISFTKNATVAITYNVFDKYVIAKVSKEDFEKGKIFDAAEFFLEKIEERIEEILSEGDYTEYQNELERIDQAESISEIELLISKYDIDKRSIVDSRQYLTDAEHLRHSKIQSKIKMLDYINQQRGEATKSLLLPDVSDNSRIFRTLGNAYTSEEVVYYGDVPEEQTIECDPAFISMFSLLEQAKERNRESQEIDNMIVSLMRLVVSGYQIEDGKLTNGESDIELGLTEEEREFFEKSYIHKSDIERQVSIRQVYDLTNGDISYRDAKLEIIAASMMSEAILRKRVFEKILKNIFPEANVEGYLKDTYSVSADIAIKQNGRGYQLTNTVNLIINQYGYDLSPEKVRSMLLSLDELPSETLFELREPNRELDKYKTFLSKQMSTNARIVSGDKEINKLEYSAEAIIEEYNWLKKRPLRLKGDRILLKEKLINGIERQDAFDDLIVLLTDRDYNNQQICAIIMNFAINGKIGNIPYSRFMNSSKEDMEEILEQNIPTIELSVEPCNIDILLGRGKKLEELKSRVMSYGVSRDLIDTVLDKNIYFADKIVSKCKFDRELTNAEKGAIITQLLDIAPLRKDKGYLLDNVFAEMSARLNLTDQEIYSAIINCAVRNNYIDDTGFAYGKLTGQYRTQIRDLIGRENDINTQVDEFTISAATGELSKTVKDELVKYGISIDFIDIKENRNVLIAKQIVEGYNFSRELTDKEKGKIIFAILNNVGLNKGQPGSLRNLYLTMEKELNLSTQEIYGAIINMGLKGNAYSKDTEHYYSTMIHQPKIEVKDFVGNEEYLSTYVEESTVLATTGILPENIAIELEEMFDLDDVLKDITPRNLMAIHEIVENYKFSYDITRLEKADIYRQFFNSSHAKSDQRILTLLNLMKKELDLEPNEIYAVLINGAINGRVDELDNPERFKYAFSEILNAPNVLIGYLKERQDKLNTVVSKETIYNILDKIPENLQTELESLGVDSELIKQNRKINVLTAKTIVEGTDFGRELDEFEKGAIYNKLLYASRNSLQSYDTFIKALEKGTKFTKQQIYGIILNTAINGNAAVKKGSDFKTLLSAPNQAAMRISLGNKKVSSRVDEYLIADATNRVPPHIVSELERIGIYQSEYERINPKNVLYAKYIADNISDSLTDMDRRAIIKGVLSYKILEDEKSNHSIKGVVDSLSDSMKLTERNAQKALVNLVFDNPNKKMRFAEYPKLLNSPGGAYKMNKSMIRLGISDMLLLKARSMALTEQECKDIKNELSALGMEEKLINDVEIYNIYIVKELMKQAGCWDEIENIGKKAVLTQMLSTIANYTGRTVSVSKGLLALEKQGFSTKEIAGIMVNSAIYQSIYKETKFTYANIIFDGDTPYKMQKDKFDIQSFNVSEYAILKSVCDNLSHEESEHAQNSLKNIGVKNELLEKNEANSYFVNYLLERLDVELSEEDKKNLANTLLGRAGEGNYNFPKFAAELSKRGFDSKDIEKIVVKTVLGIPIIDEPNFSAAHLFNRAYQIEKLAQKREKLNLELYPEDFELLKLSNLSPKDIEEVSIYYKEHNLGMLLEKKNIAELYMARKILEGSKLGKTNDEIDKRKVLLKMLYSPVLDKDRKDAGNKFGTIIRNFKEIGIPEDEVHDTFMALVFDTSRDSDSSYGKLVRVPSCVLKLSKYDFSSEIVIPEKYKIRSKSQESKRTIKNPKKVMEPRIDTAEKTLKLEQRIAETEPEEKEDETVVQIKKRLAEMGLKVSDYGFVKNKNWNTIEQIITGNDSIRDLNNEEKNAIMNQLLCGSLRKSNLETVFINMQEYLGMTKQEAMNAIINLAVNNSSRVPGYSYSRILHNSFDLQHMSKDDFDLEITEDTIFKALVYYKTKTQYTDEQIELESQNFLGRTTTPSTFKNVNPQNICTAADIVSKASFERGLTEEEQIQIAENILNTSVLLENNNIPNLLRMYVALQQKGMSDKEAANAIINVSIKQSISIPGYSYSKLLRDISIVKGLDKEVFDTEIVTEDTLRKGFANSSKLELTKENIEQRCEKARQLGINDETLKVKDPRNVAEAVKMVEEYKFERELSDEEKGAILQCLLASSKLNKGKGYFFSNLIERYKQIGLSDQEAMGALINTACGNPVSGYSMARILPTSKLVLELKREEIPKIVTSEVIKKALSKSGKEIRSALKGMVISAKDDQSLSDVSSMGQALDDLIQQQTAKKE